MTPSRSMIAHTIRTCRPVGMLAAIALAVPMTAASAEQGDEQSARPGGLVRDVRAATRNFVDVNAALAAGYVSAGDCVSGPNEGAMGVHYINAAYLEDGLIDVTRPEILVYEPRNGRLRLAAVEFFVVAEQWDAANEGPPVVGGQLFHYAGAPNRLRSPAYYELHVWAWKKNPKGTFADWNPNVSCEHFTSDAQGHGPVH